MDSPVLDSMDGLGFLDVDFQDPSVHNKSMDLEFADFLNLDAPSLGLVSGGRSSAGGLDQAVADSALAVSMNSS